MSEEPGSAGGRRSRTDRSFFPLDFVRDGRVEESVHLFPEFSAPPSLLSTKFRENPLQSQSQFLLVVVPLQAFLVVAVAERGFSFSLQRRNSVPFSLPQIPLLGVPAQEGFNVPCFYERA